MNDAAIAAFERDARRWTVEITFDAAPEEVGLSSARLGNLTRLVQRYVDGGRIPGAIALVARRGKVVHFDTIGRMDAEAGTPMAPDTIFRIYSMTKPIASVALITLYEEGRFQLDDPASKFIPEFKGLKIFAGGTVDAYETRDPAREMTVRPGSRGNASSRTPSSWPFSAPVSCVAISGWRITSR